MWKIVLNIFALSVLAFAVIYKMNYEGVEQVYSARSMGINGGDFTLQSEKGEVSLSDFKGKVVILYFGFTTCPDVCPMSLSYLNSALKGVDEEKVQVLFVSVDHKRDDPKSVDMYAKYFDESYVGVTGTKDQIDEVTKKFNVFYKFIPLENSKIGYTVDHTSRFYIIDENGVVQKAIRSDEDPKVFKKELKSVMN
ncbi:MAG: SCO family protein [Halobacteriovoraceae bacterium]|nr:SCO family protein [Halobacteriovoraceae bacterium]|tara:strand:- start:112244 stop:112828 length:585 start_codon:yes stop_codon:yes gene_type:complete